MIISNIFQKFAEIFASQGASLLPMTQAANLPPIPLVLLILAAIFAPVSITPAEKFAVSVNDTVGK
jgi:hypothetical protein